MTRAAPVGAGDRFDALPDFPWDTLAGARATAATHPGGIVDLSIGTPVDPTPARVQAALAGASDAPGYPTVHGIPALREAFRDWSIRRLGASAELSATAVLPTVGSKEAVASLPTQLGLGPGARVAVPELAYPTYEVGAVAAGATAVRYDPAVGLPDGPLALVWLNSPANPTGAVLDCAGMRRLVAGARERGAVIASDECYAEFGWELQPVSVLDPRVHGAELTGVLALHSLSKQSNLAGYRAGFLSGDPALVARLVGIRRHLGLIMAAPVQQAAAVALADDDAVAAQRSRYAARRDALRAALRAAGLWVDPSPGGLYLWASDGHPALATVDRLAGLGVLVAPGSFYGEAGQRHVRVAITATDERVAAAVHRLTG